MNISKGLLVSCRRGRERHCASEMFYVLTEKIGVAQHALSADKTNVSGLSVVKLLEDQPLDVLERIKQLVQTEGPHVFIETEKIIPIQDTCPVTPDEIATLAEKLFANREGTWRCTVVKRYHTIPHQSVIKAVAERIPNKVDLENYDWEVRIEIVGIRAGVSVLPKGTILSIAKLKTND